MSRYETTKNKKYLPALVIVFLIILMASITLYYKKNEQKGDSKIKSIAIPMVNKVANEKETISLANENGEQIDNFDQDSNDLLIAQYKITPLNLNLENSDAIFRQALTELSENLANWINIKDIIRKYIVIINDLSQQQILYKHRKFLKMPQAMQVKEDASGLFIAEESYQRYDFLANTITAIDVQKALRLYIKFRPLFEQVYDEFSYPENYRLEDIFIKAAAVIIQAPVLEKRIKLVRHSIGYKFADEKLEAMNRVDKQMLRMGAKNSRKIQEKLKQFVRELLLLSE